jgi:hypothetical protein
VQFWQHKLQIDFIYEPVNLQINNEIKVPNFAIISFLSTELNTVTYSKYSLKSQVKTESVSEQRLNNV